MSALISIIIPAHNPGSYLKECLDSCVNQSYKNFEIILVDDASTEDIVPIASKYDVTYIRSDKNIGPAAARNLGIKHSKGDLISFIDADDIMNRDKLFFSAKELERQDVHMTCGNYSIIYHGKIKPLFYKRPIQVNHDALMRINYVASGTVTVKKSVLDDIGGFNESFWIAEDYDLWIRISEKYNISYIHKVLYFYRVMNDGKSLTQRQDIQKNHDRNVNLIKKSSKERLELL